MAHTIMTSSIIQEVIELITQEEYDRLHKIFSEYNINKPFNEQSLLIYLCCDYKGSNILKVIDKLKKFAEYIDGWRGYTALMLVYLCIKDSYTLIEITKLLKHTAHIQDITCYTALMYGYKSIKDNNTLVEITKLLKHTAYIQILCGGTTLSIAYQNIKDNNTLIEITKLLYNSKYISKNIPLTPFNIGLLKDSHLFNYTYTI